MNLNDDRRARGQTIRSRALTAAVVMVLVPYLLVLAGAASVQAAFPGNDGKIAFASDRDVAAGEIYVINPGGSATRITFSNSSTDPAYSPDGSRIAFVSTDNQIFVMNADGSGRRRITDSPSPKQEPAWSSDGTRIAYVANSIDVDGQTDFEIWSIKVDGTGRKQLTNNSVKDEQPAWSPLGDKIAFVSAGPANRDIYVMNANGSGVSDVTPDSPPGCAPTCYQGHDDNPAWSPDGSTIAFVHGHTISGGGLADIWAMDSDGSDKVNVTNNDSTADSQPAWSPEGDRIAYRGIAADLNQNIYVMNANGTGQGAIDTTTSKDEKPDWQPIPICTQTVNPGNDPLVGTAGKDVLCGDDRNNTIIGGGDDDIILARGGNDKLKGDLGNDILNGGPGTDTVRYPGSTAIKASLVTGFATGAGSDVLLAVENLTGSSAKDELKGSSGANVLVGGDGADTLLGLGGADTLKSKDGVNGNDTVNGGTGNDTCITDAREASITSC